MSTSSNIYEIRLREEFKNLRKLQRHQEMQKYVEIQYADRNYGGRHSILEDPRAMNLYPETYYVKYTLPVYLDRGRLDRNWSGVFTIKVSESTFLDLNERGPSQLDLDCSNGVPFNHHVHEDHFCHGGVWSVSKEFGLWYFVIGIGGLLNQEEIWMDDSGSGHHSLAAYEYWRKDRRKQPISVINWPFDLNEGLVISEEESTPAKGKFKIGATKTFNISEQTPPKKASFTIKKP
ncbi:MAG: hypothetical protein AAFZ63_13380 [Bacteroidota bacterium]